MSENNKKAKKKDHVVLLPPNKLKEKMGSGGISTAVLEKATEIIEKHAVQFFNKANNSIIELQECCDLIPAEGVNNIDAKIWSKIYKNAHELKGEGATFGHPIISDISKTLLVYLDGFKDRPINSVILKAHINALVVILKHGIKTGDNATAKELCTTLDDIVQKSLNV